MKVYYDESPAGAGKTERAIDSIIRTKGKTLFVTERKESFVEIQQRIATSAQGMGMSPLVRHIHGDKENGSGSVVNAIQELPYIYADLSHVIVIITHAGLLHADFSDFTGWRIVIDEVPAFLDFEEKVTHLDSDYFERHYTLTRVSDMWCTVRPTEEGLGLSPASVRADDSHRHLAVFHRRVLAAANNGATRHVLCNLPNWGAMKNRRVKWCWASTFSLNELSAFDHVELLGNRFRSNIGSLLSQFFDDEDVEWIELGPLEARRFAKRAVHINYFSERPAAKSLFESEHGQVYLAEIGRHLASVLPPRHSIWSANKKSERGKPSAAISLGLPAADFLSPKQAGTNIYLRVNYAAMIYAAKPSANLRSLLMACSIDPELWTRSTEYETVPQFVTRTSIRDPKSSTPVHLYVFDRAQAKYLHEYFAGLPHVTSKITKVPLDVELGQKSRGGRPVIVRTPEEQARWKEENRRKDRERKRRARAAHLQR